MFTVVLSVLTALALAMEWPRPYPFDDALGLLAGASAVWLPWAAAEQWRSAIAARASAPTLPEPDEDFADTMANWHPVEQEATHRAAGG